MSWAEANLNDDPIEVLSRRITDLEDTIATQLTELRGNIDTAVEAMRDAATGHAQSFLAGFEDQLADAISVSLRSVATEIQHAVVLALSSMEQPASAADVERVNNRIDELRSLLLG